MKNPWLDLQQRAPFVLPCDTSVVSQHNSLATERGHGDRVFDTGLRPVPYIGNPCGKVVLLTLNPGVKRGDEDVQHTSVYAKLNKLNLRHETPYYYLSDALPECPGKAYNRRQLRALIETVGLDVVREQVFLAQYYPYHSGGNPKLGTSLPSQRYTFKLVAEAVTRGALVIALRSSDLWQTAVSQLRSYHGFLDCSNPRSPTVSPRSLRKDRGFERVCEMLTR